MLDDKVTRELEKIVGPENVLTDPFAKAVYECDGATLFKASADAIVFPENTKQVARIVKLAQQEGIPYLARGAGTGLSGGALPIAGGLILAMNRMNRILEIDTVNRRAVVEPGVIHMRLAESADGFYYAPDPSSQVACTMGGTVAENAGGPHCLKYGVTSNHVLALEVVTPDGEIVEFGTDVEDAPGYDLVGLMIGAEGTLGIVTRITVRLTRVPEAYKTLLAIFESVDDASEAVSEVIARGIIPGALELMDQPVIKAVEAAFSWGLPLDAGAVLVIELDGPAHGMEAQADEIVSICNDHGCRDVQVAKDDAERDLLWTARKKAVGALGRLAPSYLIQDGVVPLTKLPEAIRRVTEISKEIDIPIANLAHAGDGNLHPILLYDQRDPDECRKVLKAGELILQACVELGGTVSGEHGIGVEKNEQMTLLYSPEDLAFMLRLRSIFNPDNLCNPDKMFPTGRSYVALGGHQSAQSRMTN